MLLDTQYRMHPAIAEFPSQQFYQGRLKTGSRTEPGQPPSPLQGPVTLIDVAGGRDEPAGASKVNRAEAAEVDKLVRTMLMHESNGLTPDQIGELMCAHCIAACTVAFHDTELKIPVPSVKTLDYCSTRLACCQNI